MGRKWFVLLDRYGLQFEPAHSVLMEFESVADMRLVVFTTFHELLMRIRVPRLAVYASWDAFYRGDAPLAHDASVSALGATEKAALVIVAPVAKSALPAEPMAPAYGTPVRTTTEDVVWLGARQGILDDARGVALNDARTLARRELTLRTVKMLDESRVLQAIAPPMTGKTSLMALVCRELHNQSIDHQLQEQPQAVAIASVSTCTIEDEPFRLVFLRQCGINWDQFLALRDRGYKIYIVVDDCQLLYHFKSGGPDRGSFYLWQLVEKVLADANLDIHVMLLACHANMPLVPPALVPANQRLGADSLLYTRKEIEEYVIRWFDGVRRLGEALPEFCVLLQALTGGLAGFCATAIEVLNEMFDSRRRRVCPPPTADEWIDTIRLGSLDDRRLLARFEITVAIHVFSSVEHGAKARLERLLYGEDDNTEDDEAFLRGCIGSGILEEREGHLNFFTPVIWRFFVKDCVERQPRAADAPATLQQLMERIQQTIDYTGVHKVLRRDPHNTLALERACQLALYKAVYRSTPRSFRTSVDDGALFGSSEFLDFMVRQGQTRWGIELLRDASKWHELVARFAPGGQYARLGLAEGCVVRFGCATTGDGVILGEMTAEGVSMGWDDLAISFAALGIGEVSCELVEG